MSNDESNSQIKKWVFIGGAPRSGTSLLQAIMNEHDECFSPPESHILETFVYAPTTASLENFHERDKLIKQIREDKWIHRLGIGPEKMVDRLSIDAKPVDLFKTYMQEYAATISKNIIVEGGPANVWFLKKLNNDFSNCYFLHIIRDPRDVVLSTQQAGYNSKFVFPPLQIAHQFMTGYQNAVNFEHLYENRYLNTYYEELVSNPEKVVKEICDVLEIDFQPSMLEFNKHSENVYSKEETWKKNLAKPIIKNNFGKWKTEMNKKDLVFVEQACKSFFKKETGRYEMSDVKKQTGFPAYVKYLASYYVSEIKNIINSKITRTTKELDEMPIYVRMKHSGILEK